MKGKKLHKPNSFDKDYLDAIDAVKKRLALKTEGKYLSPISIEIHPCDNDLICWCCCGYCWGRSIDFNCRNINSTQEFWTKILAEIKKVPSDVTGAIDAIKISGAFTEPLLYEYVPELLLEASSIAPISIHTKLLWLPVSLLEAISKCGRYIKYINISLNAYDKVSYSQTNPINHRFCHKYGLDPQTDWFESVLANITNIKKIATEIVVSYQITRSSTFLANGRFAFDQLEALFGRLDGIKFKFSIPWSSKSNPPWALADAEQADFVKQFESRFGDRENVTLISAHPTNQFTVCRSLYSPVITATGHLMPCCQFPNIENSISLVGKELDLWNGIKSWQTPFVTNKICWCDRRNYFINNSLC